MKAVLPIRNTREVRKYLKKGCASQETYNKLTKLIAKYGCLYIADEKHTIELGDNNEST